MTPACCRKVSGLISLLSASITHTNATSPPPQASAKSRSPNPSSMVLESWFKKLTSAAGIHSIWQDAAPPGSNDVPVPTSRTLLHTVLHGLVLLVVLRVLKWTWTKAGFKPSNTTFVKSDVIIGKTENKNREHGGQSSYLYIGMSAYQLLQFRVDSAALRLSRGHPLCVRTQECEACSISSISVG